MNKSLLLEFIKGETSRDQDIEILNWIASSPLNEDYFHRLHNLWVISNISNKEASELELMEFKKRVKGRRVNFKKLLPYAAAFILLLSLLFNLYYAGYRRDITKYDKTLTSFLETLPKEYKHELYTENGVKARVVLPDSSIVWLNSGSKIVYPDKFSGKTREIQLSGEGYFNVKPNPSQPMIISTNKNFSVKVLGTTFNLKSYENDLEATTTLYTGSINIISHKNVKDGEPIELITELKPLETCVITKDKGPVISKRDNIKDLTAWKEGKIIFDATPMSEVIKILERWHGVKFIIKEKEVFHYDITARFNTESIVQIMEMIKYCSLVDYKIDSTTVILSSRKI